MLLPASLGLGMKLERFIREAFLELGDVPPIADFEGCTRAATTAASPEAPSASPARNARYSMRNLSMLSTSMPMAASLSSERNGSERIFLISLWPLQECAFASGANKVVMNAKPSCTSEES